MPEPKFKIGDRVHYGFRRQRGKGIIQEIYDYAQFGYWYGVKTLREIKMLRESDLRLIEAK